MYCLAAARPPRDGINSSSRLGASAAAAAGTASQPDTTAIKAAGYRDCFGYHSIVPPLPSFTPAHPPTPSHTQMLRYTDQRVKLMNQLLVGIRVLKMYAWEVRQREQQGAGARGEGRGKGGLGLLGRGGGGRCQETTATVGGGGMVGEWLPPAPRMLRPTHHLHKSQHTAPQAAQEAAVMEVRRNELGRLRKAIPFRVGMQSMLFAAPILAMVVCFAVYGSGACSAGLGGMPFWGGRARLPWGRRWCWA